MNHFITCGKCDEVIFKSQGSEAKIRGKIITIRDNKVYAVCKGCNSEIPVPLSLDLKAHQSKNLPLFIDNTLDKHKLVK